MTDLHCDCDMPAVVSRPYICMPINKGNYIINYLFPYRTSVTALQFTIEVNGKIVHQTVAASTIKAAIKTAGLKARNGESLVIKVASNTNIFIQIEQSFSFYLTVIISSTDLTIVKTSLLELWQSGKIIICTIFR